MHARDDDLASRSGYYGALRPFVPKIRMQRNPAPEGLPPILHWPRVSRPHSPLLALSLSLSLLSALCSLLSALCSLLSALCSLLSALCSLLSLRSALSLSIYPMLLLLSRIFRTDKQQRISISPYKWGGGYCWVSLSSRLRSQEGIVIQWGACYVRIGGVLQ